jgi:peptidoglycan/LPS O-acetylase OafA/YrhL
MITNTLDTPAVKEVARFDSSRRIPELDGLRAFAILPVILLHCHPTDGHWHWLAMIGQRGGIGVSLFFVLSGYLITGILLDSVHKSHYYRNFIARRAIRIFPLYYATLALFTLFPGLIASPAIWAAQQHWGMGWFFAYAGNIRQAWLAQWPPVVSFSPLWSLQVEEQYYLLFPWIVYALSRRNLTRFLAACILIAPILRWLVVYVKPSNWMSAAVLTPCRVDALAMGGLVAIAVRSEIFLFNAKRTRSLAVAVVAIPGLVSLLLKQDGPLWANPFTSSAAQFCVNVMFTGLLAWTLFAPQNRLVALLRWAPLTYTGKISYGLYLLHIPASWIARNLIQQSFGIEVAAHSRLAVPVTYAAAFAAAALSWHLFESRILKLKSRFPSTASYQTSPAPRYKAAVPQSS